MEASAFLSDWKHMPAIGNTEGCMQVPREYPFDNLKAELGGFDVKGSTQH